MPYSNQVFKDQELEIHSALHAEKNFKKNKLKKQYLTLSLLVGVFIFLTIVFSFIFHQIMAYEGKEHSWPTSIYWSLTTMSTLGYGDITFSSDIGRIFSVFVLLSGSVFLLVFLPFIFIQFVFLPWVSSKENKKIPKKIPARIKNHIVLTNLGSVELALIQKCMKTGLDYVLITDNEPEAKKLEEEGYISVFGEFDDPLTYKNAGVERARLVVCTRSDMSNTNIALTIKEINQDVKITSFANSKDSVDILKIAGADNVIQLGKVLGKEMAKRSINPDGKSHIIGSFKDLQIAEVNTKNTSMVGKTIEELNLQENFGINVLGYMFRKNLDFSTKTTPLSENCVLLLAATKQQLKNFDKAFAAPINENNHTIVIGSGRVGRAVARYFKKQWVSCTVVDKDPLRKKPGLSFVLGDAADRKILEKASLEKAGVVLITPHDDDMNIYLTRYIRGLRPDVQIVARSRLHKNISTLYRAGADMVMSYSHTGASAIWNTLDKEKTFLLDHDLNVFKVKSPPSVEGLSIKQSKFLEKTNCKIVALEKDNHIEHNIYPHTIIPKTSKLVLLGTHIPKNVRF